MGGTGGTGAGEGAPGAALPERPARDVPQAAQNRVPARLGALQAGFGQTVWSADGAVAVCVMARVPESSANDDQLTMMAWRQSPAICWNGTGWVNCAMGSLMWTMATTPWGVS
jgi:hypothetical protein